MLKLYSHSHKTQNILSITLLIAFGFTAQIAADDIKVDVAQGTLQGQSYTTAAGVTFYSFQGIPYAKPPVGELRFKAPQPLESWEDVRDATKVGSDCPAPNIILPSIVVGNEDCLFLNVYTSQLPPGEDSRKLPVMVWIHGGGFSTGSGSTNLYGPDYIMNNGDLVLVTINYRLGALGFLGLNHPDVSKNNGMKDQVAALKWVQNNIDKFGGNPDDVTIFGESAGGASVHYQLLTPLSEGLFHKAIAQSGSALDMWAYTDPETAHERAVGLAEQMELNTSDSSVIFDSLMTADLKDILEAQSKLPSPLYLPTLQGTTLIFSPTLEDNAEDSFLPDTPINILKSGKFQQVPYITGTTSAEGKTFAWGAKNDPTLLKQYDENREVFVPKDLGLEEGSPESLAVTEKIVEQYFGNESISQDTIPELVAFESDFGIVIGVHRAVKLQLALGTSPIYKYLFSYEGRFGLTELLLMRYTFKGAGHGDDVGYLFKFYEFNITLPADAEEFHVIDQITKLWTDFAKTGNPTTNFDFDWQPFTEETQTYLNIDKEITIEDWSSFEPENIAVWDSIYEDVDKLEHK